MQRAGFECPKIFGSLRSTLLSGFGLMVVLSVSLAPRAGYATEVPPIAPRSALIPTIFNLHNYPTYFGSRSRTAKLPSVFQQARAAWRERSADLPTQTFKKDGLTRVEIDLEKHAPGRKTVDVFLPEGEGPYPVVSIQHGWMAQGREHYSALAEEFARNGVAVVLPNLPNQHLEVDPAKWAENHLVALAAALEKFPKLLDVNRMVIGGHSLGGAVSLKLAATLPTVFRGAYVHSGGNAAGSTLASPWLGLDYVADAQLLAARNAHVMLVNTTLRDPAGVFAMAVHPILSGSKNYRVKVFPGGTHTQFADIEDGPIKSALGLTMESQHREAYPPTIDFVKQVVGR